MAQTSPTDRLQRMLQRTTMPALPRVPVGVTALPPSRNLKSPNKPSPLRESAVIEELEACKIDENGGVILSTTPDGTPPRNGSPHKHTQVQNAEVQEFTPPNSKYATEGPLVVDSSIYHDYIELDQQHSSPSQVVQPARPEDPFVSTPLRQNQVLVNPSAIPLTQISAIIQANLAHPRVATMEAPREDRLNQAVTVHNAQGLFPREAKLFVANLSNLRTNDQLEISVASIFNQFGPCTTIIKRDRNHQPMGFVQYHLIQDAEVAMDNANGCSIDGRIIRIEWASARQELIISMLTNQPLSEQSVRQALIGRGPVVSIKPTGPPISDGHTSTAWLVEFRYYADCKEAIKLTREDNVYRVVPAPKAQRQAPYPLAAPRTPQGTLYQNNDSKSIFLGGLPDSVTEAELRELFAYLGTIVSCNIISKPITTGGINTFAFMEFKYAEDAASATNAVQFLRGQKIRVERKQYAQRRAARVAAAAGPMTIGMEYSRPSPYVTHSYGNAIDVDMPVYHAATPYGANQSGFTISDYNVTPPTLVYMAAYDPYTSPVHLHPHMRNTSSQHGIQQSPHAMHYANAGPHNAGLYGAGSAGFGSMNVITEEQEGSVFD